MSPVLLAVLVGVLGGIGAATRFAVDGMIRGRWSRLLPVATITINVTGSALIGVLAGALATGAISADVYAIAATGFCGGYTTFSTAMVESVRLVASGDLRRGVVNAFGTLAVTVIAATLGLVLGLQFGS
ncbi:fluoride efflux transporter FluC [Occultella gossypii]|uniref:Fluoride-specific ion channel FluC n=1 Tax=Occultella gossypii TaxID=2800820 RepID=A0ABS7SD41_9MICO|nr:CrcB family protein [Occultella gossypii]MBZ2198271.1 CrcB family protein [Occultella gossypii]